jgi:hypothetical protein
MPSVFSGNTQTINGVIRAEDVVLTFGGGDSKGAIIQQAEWSLERSVNMLYEVGSQNVYYVGDRRKGQGRFSRVVGGAKNFKTMVTKFGKLCDAKTNFLNLSVGASSCGPGGGGGKVTYKLLGVTLTSIGASVTANDIVVTENMGLMFVDMEYT